jgi:hypothetical protein
MRYSATYVDILKQGTVPGTAKCEEHLVFGIHVDHPLSSGRELSTLEVDKAIYAVRDD